MYRQDRTRARMEQHIAALGDPDQSVAQRAERHLIRYYGARALELLIPATTNGNPLVRFRAVWILGKTRDPRAYEAIAAATGDPSPDVRDDAVLALGNLGDARAIELLISLLQNPDSEGASDCAAATALAKLGDTAVPALVAVLERSDAPVRSLAVNALAIIGSEASVEALRHLLCCSDEQARMDAIEALGIIGTPQSLELIGQYRHDPSEAVRDIANDYSNPAIN